MKQLDLAHRQGGDIPSFRLLETMLWTPDAGVALLSGHLARLADSARQLDFACDPVQVRAALQDATRGMREPMRLRLLVGADGMCEIRASSLDAQPEPLVVAIAAEPVHSADPALRHKTDRREPYDRRRASQPHCDDVLLVNERGELTEFALGNLVVELDGAHWTPPLASGVLPGVLRAELLRAGALAERTLRPADLERARSVERINAVRGRQRVRVIG